MRADTPELSPAPLLTDEKLSAVSFYEALRFWLQLGFISFGGPAGQIAIMHRELVEKRRWLSEKRDLRDQRPENHGQWRAWPDAD